MSGADISGGDNAQAIASAQLRSLIERIERLEEEKASYADDIKSVYKEGKDSGFDVKTMRQMVRERKMDDAKRREKYMMEDLYRTALHLADEGLD